MPVPTVGRRSTGSREETRGSLLRKALRAFRRHLARPVIRFNIVAAALCFVVYFVLYTRVDPVPPIVDVVQQVLLVLASVLIGLSFAPELKQDLWRLKPSHVRRLIPAKDQVLLAQALIGAAAGDDDARSQDSSWSRLVWERALAPLLDASRHRWQVVYDMDYRIEVHKPEDRDFDGQTLRVVPFTADSRSERILARDDPRDNPPSAVVSITRTRAALMREFENPECILRELVPLDGLDPAAWRRAVIATCQPLLEIDSRDVPLVAVDPDPDDAREQDVVRFKTRDVFDRSTERKLVRVRIDAFLDPAESDFPVAFSGYYCAGHTQVEFKLRDHPGVTLNASHFFGRGLHQEGHPELSRRTTGSTQEVHFSTGRDAVLWPGSGILFHWQRQNGGSAT
jgi:hypothetical protein